MSKIRENPQYYLLKSSKGIKNTKWKHSIGKSSPRIGENGFVLIL